MTTYNESIYDSRVDFLCVFFSPSYTIATKDKHRKKRNLTHWIYWFVYACFVTMNFKSPNKRTHVNFIKWESIGMECMLVLCCVIFFSFQRIVFVFVFAGYTFSAPQFSHLQTYIYNTQSVSLSLSIGLCPLHARRARFRNFGFFFEKKWIRFNNQF